MGNTFAGLAIVGKINSAFAYWWFERRTSAKVHVPIESTNVTGTQFSDLNNNCLKNIISRLTITDLCSLRELSEMSNNIRLKKITDKIFAQKYNACDLNEDVNGVHEAERVIINFGPLITHISLSLDNIFYVVHQELIEDIVKYCGGTLKSLQIYFGRIDVKEPSFPNLERLEIFDCRFRIGTTNLFANCSSLVELNIHNHNYLGSNEHILQQTFPKLEIFKGTCKSEIFENFVSRHKQLKFINWRGSFETARILQAITEHCSGLEKFIITMIADGSAMEYEDAVRSLVKLKHLEDVTIRARNVSNGVEMMIRQLGHLMLKKLRLECKSPVTLSDVSDLKLLEDLSILMDNECNINFNPLAELHRLKLLELSSPGLVDFDLVDMVGQLPDLKQLQLNFQTHYYKTYRDVVPRIINARLRHGGDAKKLKIQCLKETKPLLEIEVTGRGNVVVKDNLE